MAERMPPEAVVAASVPRAHDSADLRLRRHLEKYIGDAVFAVFGLTSAGPDDAANALRCAELTITALADWNAERGRRNEPPLAIGIGLDYGLAVVGDVGSEQSLSFTVIATLSSPRAGCKR